MEGEHTSIGDFSCFCTNQGLMLAQGCLVCKLTNVDRQLFVEIQESTEKNTKQSLITCQLLGRQKQESKDK